MRTTEIRIIRRANLGNYEHQEIEVTAVLDHNDDFREVYKQLANDVEAVLYGPKKPGKTTSAETIKQVPKDDLCDYIIEFGKYAGQAVGDIKRKELADYAKWLSSQKKSGKIRDEGQNLLDVLVELKIA